MTTGLHGRHRFLSIWITLAAVLNTCFTWSMTAEALHAGQHCLSNKTPLGSCVQQLLLSVRDHGDACKAWQRRSDVTLAAAFELALLGP